MTSNTAMTTMTNNFPENEFEPDKSISSSSSNFSIDMLGDTIYEVEENLLRENEKAASEEEKQYSLMSQNFLTDEDLAKQREEEITEKRYKSLIHLLKSSEMYTVLLKSRMEKEAEKRKKQSNSTKSNSNKLTSKPQKSFEKFNLGEVLTEKQIEENVIKKEQINPEVEIFEDYFKEIRVTNLGFTVSYKQPALLEGGTMKDYQLKGLDWMINLFVNGVNGILADEMGLGKTIQVISFICYLIEQGIQGPFLIIAPLSTLSNWMNEFKRFAPQVPTLLYHGPEPERRALLPNILKINKVGNQKAHKVVLTSFEVPLRDKSLLGRINWYYLIVDEGHRIKNHNSMLSRTLREFNTIGRLLLTGTPLQNSLSELWSLLNFLLPEVFSSLNVFESWFDIKELEKNGAAFMQEKLKVDVINILQQILIPFLLRRTKKDVNLQLPPKKEIVIYCPMTQRQEKLYEATLNGSIELLEKRKDNTVSISEFLPKRRCFLRSPYGLEKKSEAKVKKKPIMTEVKVEKNENFLTKVVLSNPHMELRKIASHPYLIEFPLVEGTEELRIDEDIVKESGKMLVLDAVLAKLKSRGHKVLIFSYFKVVLDILEDYAIMRNYTYCRLDGSLKFSDRDEEISKFNSDSDTFIFFITIRAGLGINLTSADTVIFFDSDWNPQVNMQAQDRCHRIGQNKPVVVYRLCTVGTIDEKIIERGCAKRRLEKMILQKGVFTLDFSTSKRSNLRDLQELKKLLESKDHQILNYSNGFVLTDDNLETLLDRSNLKTTSEDTEYSVLNYPQKNNYFS